MLSFVYRARALCAYERGDDEAFEAARMAFEATGSSGSMSARKAELLAVRAKMAYRRGNREEGRALLAEAMAVDFGGAASMAPSLPMVRDWCDGGCDRAAAFSPTAASGLADRLFDLSIAYVLNNVGRFEEVRDLADAVDSRYFSLRIRALTLGAAFADKVARRSDALRWVREAYHVAKAQGLEVAFLENAAFLQGLCGPLRQGGPRQVSAMRRRPPSTAPSPPLSKAPAVRRPRRPMPSPSASWTCCGPWPMARRLPRRRACSSYRARR